MEKGEADDKGEDEEQINGKDGPEDDPKGIRERNVEEELEHDTEKEPGKEIHAEHSEEEVEEIKQRKPSSTSLARNIDRQVPRFDLDLIDEEDMIERPYKIARKPRIDSSPVDNVGLLNRLDSLLPPQQEAQTSNQPPSATPQEAD